MSNLKYWLWLTTRRGLAGQQLLTVLNHFGSPEGAYFSDQGEYRLVEGLSDEARRSMEDKSLDDADRIIAGQTLILPEIPKAGAQGQAQE